jgi:hypothetical protein
MIGRGMIRKRIVSGFLFAVCQFSGLAIAGSLPLEPGVENTPANSYITAVKIELSKAAEKPMSLEDATRLMRQEPSGLFKDDIGNASKAANDVACARSMQRFSGRAKAMVYTEEFWRRLTAGKTREMIQHSSAQGNADLIFVQFYERYLNEYALAWGLRDRDSKLYDVCTSYGVGDATTCLKGLLVLGTVRSGCGITIADQMFVYLLQPLPDAEK